MVVTLASLFLLSDVFPFSFLSPNGNIALAESIAKVTEFGPGNEPDLAPNAKSIVFWTAGSSPGITSLNILDIFSKVRKSVLVGNVRHPRFSPSGDQIVFALEKAGKWQPALISVQDPGKPIILNAPDGANPEWLPNGRSLIWSTLLGYVQIDLQGKEVWSRPKPGPPEAIPTWNDRIAPSPVTADRLIVSRLVPNKSQQLVSELYLSTGDSTLTLVPVGDRQALQPTWTYDGTAILFTGSTSEGKDYVYAVNADGTGLRSLLPGSQPSQ